MCTVKNNFRFIFLAAIMLMGVKNVAQIISDTTGTLTWNLDTSVHSLTISGIGEMPNYLGYAPWYSHRNSIVTVEIDSGVTSIGDYAFSECSNLTSVSIPSGITSIGMYAFCQCSNLSLVTIPSSVINIGEGAFQYCSNLTSINIPDSITDIHNSTFQQCSNLSSVNIPYNVTSIGNAAFYGCSSLTSIIIPDRVKTIDSYAFISCSSLISVTIPDSVSSIGRYAFGLCSNLKAINVNSNNTTFTSENGVLFNKSKTVLMQYPIGKISTYYTVPNSVDSIATSAFRTCAYLNTVTIPDNVTRLGSNVFDGCYNLRYVTIGNSVKSLGQAVFLSCGSLADIYSFNDIPPLAYNNSTFSGVDKNSCRLHVPIGCQSKYAAADGWQEFFNIVEDLSIYFITANYKLQVYPNPTTGQLIIDNGQLTIQNIDLYDVIGQKINYQLSTVNYQLSIDISHLANGLYFLKVDGQTVKIVKE